MLVNRILVNVQLLPLYLVLAYTMGLPGWTKLFDNGRVIGKYVDMFSNTFVSVFPGTPAMIYLLGVMELSVVGLLGVSLIKMEFLAGRPKLWLRLALFMAVMTFANLGFGLRLIENHDGAANQYYYFGVSSFFFWYVSKKEIEQDASIGGSLEPSPTKHSSRIEPMTRSA